MNRRITALVLITLTWTTAVASADETRPTFSADVAKIGYAKCSICHRPGSSGPFPLITYEDFKRRAGTIEAVLESKYMPPWKPLDHGISFANDRSLTKTEESTLKKWIAAGCPQGDLQSTPPPPKFTDGWALGKPDLVVSMQGEFQVPADGPDVYRSFVFPVDLPDDKWVKAVELRPMAPSAVHHALFFLDTTGSAKSLDGKDGQAGLAGMGFLPIQSLASGEKSNSPKGWLQRWRNSEPKSTTSRVDRFDSAFGRGLGAYVPGSMPSVLPGDLAMSLPAGSDIIMQTHFHPSGKPEREHAQLALYFADGPPSKQLVPVQVPPLFGFAANIDIPAEEKNYTVEESFTLPIDVQAISVGGHAHYICRAMTMTAKLPDGKTKVLMEIDDWDLDWQDRYIFEAPIDLPAGTVIETTLVYDNSTENPENPYSPPKRIRWGRESNDEMGGVTLQVVAGNETERPQLQAAVREQFVGAVSKRFSGSGGIAKLLRQMDLNQDGKLQPSEAPPRINRRAFELFDKNKDGGLDEAELNVARQFAERLGK